MTMLAIMKSIIWNDNVCTTVHLQLALCLTDALSSLSRPGAAVGKDRTKELLSKLTVQHSQQFGSERKLKGGWVCILLKFELNGSLTLVSPVMSIWSTVNCHICNTTHTHTKHSWAGSKGISTSLIVRMTLKVCGSCPGKGTSPSSSPWRKTYKSQTIPLNKQFYICLLSATQAFQRIFMKVSMVIHLIDL